MPVDSAEDAGANEVGKKSTEIRPESASVVGTASSVEYSSSAGVAPSTVGGIPNTAGWHQIPHTKLAEVCPLNGPQYAFASNCTNVVAAWSGGIADQNRNRLVVWGGGHNHYNGNELYFLNLNNIFLT